MFRQINFLLLGPEDDKGGGGGAPPDAPPPDAPLANSFLNQDLTFKEGWQNGLPAEFDEFKPTLANYRDLKGFAKSLVDNKRAAIGKLEGHVKLPTDKSTTEEKAAFLKHFGVPEKPEDYVITKPEGDIGNYYDPAKASEFGKMAHSLGVPQTAAQKLVEWQLLAVANENDAVLAEGRKFIDDREGVLKETWGSSYGANMLDVERLMKTLGVDTGELQMTSPALTIGLATLAKRLGEDALVSREAVANKVTQPALAYDIQTNPNNPDYMAYRDSSHPRHNEVVDRVVNAA